MTRLAWAVVLASAFMAVAGCGGGDDGAALSADEKLLGDLRTQAETSNFNMLEASERQALCLSALAIAERNVGQPLGGEAFALAEDVFLRSGNLPELTLRVPAAPEAAGASFNEFRAKAGFLQAVPEGYQSTAVVEALHADLVEYADRRLTDLEYARNNRMEWAQELEGTGTTKTTWFRLAAILDNGVSQTMGSASSEDYARHAAALRYLRDIAAIAESQEFLEAWDLVTAAVSLGAYEPPILDYRYEDGTFIHTYTEDAVAGGAANAQQLADAIAAARNHFPPGEE